MAANQKKTVKRRDVERALAGVLKSEQFANSAQLSDFLTFIVAKTLDNKSSEIKAYTIAVDALGRGEDFDPQTNAAVRVAAGRLRQSLALYNAKKSQKDAPVKIVLEPGSYVPIFEVQSTAPDALTKAVEGYVFASDFDITPEHERVSEGTSISAVQTSETPPTLTRADHSGKLFGLTTRGRKNIAALGLVVVAAGTYFLLNRQETQHNKLAEGPAAIADQALVNANQRPRITTTFLLPDAPYPKWYEVGEVADSIELIMARFDDFQFINAVTAQTFPPNDRRSADYHLLITAHRRGENVRMFGKLIREEDNTILWTTERLFKEPPTVTDRNVPGITGQIFSSIVSPGGVIFADIMRPKTEEESAHNKGQLNPPCFVATHYYFSNKTIAAQKAAIECGEKLVKQGSQLPSVYAALTSLYLDQYLESVEPDKEHELLGAADTMALKAIQYGPQSARAYQAQFQTHVVQSHHDEAERAAQKALSLNPYDASIIGDYATWLISIGKFKKGKELLLKAESLLETHPTQLEAYKYLALDLTKDFDAADEVASHMDISRSSLTAFSVALSAHRTGNANLRKQAIELLNKRFVDLSKRPKINLIKRGFGPSIAEVLATKLLLAQKAVAEANQN